MIDTHAWLEGNDTYLERALEWLRLRLSWLAKDGVDEEELITAADAMDAAAQAMSAPPALHSLAEQLGLTPGERDVLLLCAGVELDPRLELLCARAQGDERLAYPTFALALALFGDHSWDLLSPAGGLRAWRLVEIADGGGPLTLARLRADERIVNHVKGIAHLDERVEPLVERLTLPTEPLPPSQQAVADAGIARCRQLDGTAPPDVLQLLGPDAAAKRAIAAEIAQGLGLHGLYRLPAEVLPPHADEVELLARVWQRESILLSVGLLLDAGELDGAPVTDPAAQAVRRFLARSPGVFLLGARERWTALPRPDLALDAAPPTLAEERDLWQRALGAHAPGAPEALAAQFRLDPATIAAIASRELAAGDGDDLAARVWDGALASTRPRLDALAQRIDPVATWDDLVLGADELALLRQIAAQVASRAVVYDRWGFGARMNRGLGISVLFAGPSGTGKTMAAEVLANDLRLGLYRVDLSAVVSKYIGETEKNLRRLFDAAEAGGALLLFDEADALFGKRSEVKDSHDRYANIEINYLLQRMEGYRGLAILATNAKTALDGAFLRRLRFVVDFPVPGRAERRAIWARAFPAATPAEPLDLDRLAELAATGGTIHNIALNAAFVAARASAPVSMDVILQAARTEFRKLEQPAPELTVARGGRYREAVPA